MTGRDVVVKAEGLTRHFFQGGEIVKALQELDLTVHQGEFLAVTGASGSGKSTLLNMIGLLDAPTNGRLFLNGADTKELGPKEKTALRLHSIGFVFQFFNLQTNLSALENVMLPAWIATGDRKRSVELARSLLERVGLGDRLGHLPSQLSGGQQQKVSIARALVNSPGIILADEPTGNLDSMSTMEVMKIFREINEAGHTLIMVTHEQDIAAMTHREIRLLDGKLLVSG